MHSVITQADLGSIAGYAMMSIAGIVFSVTVLFKVVFR